VPSGKATNSNFAFFGLTRLELEPTIYNTPDEHVNHYTTDAVDTVKIHVNYSYHTFIILPSRYIYLLRKRHFFRFDAFSM
jgi:hypothetical protein